MKLDVQDQGVGRILYVDGDGGLGGLEQLDNFHGRHLFIIPCAKSSTDILQFLEVYRALVIIIIKIVTLYNL